MVWWERWKSCRKRPGAQKLRWRVVEGPYRDALWAGGERRIGIAFIGAFARGEPEKITRCPHGLSPALWRMTLIRANRSRKNSGGSLTWSATSMTPLERD